MWTSVFWATDYYIGTQTRSAKSQTPTRTKVPHHIEQRSSTAILDDPAKLRFSPHGDSKMAKKIVNSYNLKNQIVILTTIWCGASNSLNAIAG